MPAGRRRRHRYRMERDTLWARLSLRSGRYDEAYRRLKQTMRLAAPEREPLRWQARLLRLRLKSERQAMTDAYALLAVASRETGHLDDYEWALAGARERGVDVVRCSGSDRGNGDRYYSGMADLQPL